ncbi:Protein MIZU-KUSSEI 1 [Linum grandiflorum]
MIELAVSTASLVKEMSSGLVRIALECEKSDRSGKLFDEPVWSMYCNGRKCGYATARGRCSEVDTRVLTTVRTVSVGAGVIPTTTVACGGGELMYMRAKFERVVGSRDSEAFYMMNPDGNGGPELSLFLLRL